MLRCIRLVLHSADTESKNNLSNNPDNPPACYGKCNEAKRRGHFQPRSDNLIYFLHRTACIYMHPSGIEKRKKNSKD